MSDVWTTRRLQGTHGAVPEAPKQFEGTRGEHDAVWTVLRMAEPHVTAVEDLQEVTNGRVAASPYPNELDDKSLMDRLFFGSPETVIAKLKRAASVGVTHISDWMMCGGIEHEKLMRSIRLMGEEVIPALREVQPPAERPAQVLDERVITNVELQASRLGRAPRDMAT
jgi:alkanesulfonate monooxygenase SsuD/methylene tetrahydromethanopterin reductase-like flavin-dependent oxidoreductase (luciferase family)